MIIAMLAALQLAAAQDTMPRVTLEIGRAHV